MANSAFRHWAVKHRERKAYYQRAQVAIQNQRHEWINVPLPRPVTVRATLFVHQRMDEDNLAARLKWAIDSLVHADVLEDDTPDYLKLRVAQAIDRKNPRVEFTFLGRTKR